MRTRTIVLIILAIAIAAILGAYDSTGPGLVDAERLNEPGERSR